MPANGVTQRTLARMAGRHFRDEVRIFKMTGTVNEVPQWSELSNTFFNGKLVGKSGTIYAPDNNSQTYSCEVIIIGNAPVLEPTERYRLEVKQYKTPVETDSEPPEEKRTFYLEPILTERKQDNFGTDVGLVLLCKNGDAPATGQP